MSDELFIDPDEQAAFLEAVFPMSDGNRRESIKIDRAVLDILRFMSQGSGKSVSRIISELVLQASSWYDSGLAHKSRLLERIK